MTAPVERQEPPCGLGVEEERHGRSQIAMPGESGPYARSRGTVGASARETEADADPESVTGEKGKEYKRMRKLTKSVGTTEKASRLSVDVPARRQHGKPSQSEYLLVVLLDATYNALEEDPTERVKPGGHPASDDRPEFEEEEE